MGGRPFGPQGCVAGPGGSVTVQAHTVAQMLQTMKGVPQPTPESETRIEEPLKAEELLMSASSLLSIMESQAAAEGRPFTKADAMKAFRPVLESLLSELIEAQDGGAPCRHCGRKSEITAADIPIVDYEIQDVQDILDELENLSEADLKVLHAWEKNHQNRSQILSGIVAAYGNPIEDPVPDQERAAQTQAKIDKVFTDIFGGQA